MSAEAAQPKVPFKVAASSFLGNFIEWFDYATYTYFAITIGIVFDGIVRAAQQALAAGVAVGIGTDSSCPYITQYDMWREVVYFERIVGASRQLALHTGTLGRRGGQGGRPHRARPQPARQPGSPARREDGHGPRRARRTAAGQASGRTRCGTRRVSAEGGLLAS